MIWPGGGSSRMRLPPGYFLARPLTVPYFSRDRRDIGRLTVNAGHLDFQMYHGVYYVDTQARWQPVTQSPRSRPSKRGLWTVYFLASDHLPLVATKSSHGRFRAGLTIVTFFICCVFCLANTPLPPPPQRRFCLKKDKIKSKLTKIYSSQDMVPSVLGLPTESQSF